MAVAEMVAAQVSFPTYFLSLSVLRLAGDETRTLAGAFRAIRNHSNINLNCVCVFHEMK